MDTNNENRPPMGGTELMLKELERRLPQRLEQYSVFNYPIYADVNKKIVYWNQLSYDQAAVGFLKDDPTAIDQIDHFVFVSHWQAEEFRQRFGIPGWKTSVIKNACIGVGTKIWGGRPEKIRVCYTSTPWRGLDVLLRAWEILQPENAELHIFSSAWIYGTDYGQAVDGQYNALYEKARSLPGVVYRGSIPNDELRKELSGFHILAYPSTFEETSCIAVIEALSAGLRVITSNLGALPETTEGWARMYPFLQDSEKHAQTFAGILGEEIQRYLTNPNQVEKELIEQATSYRPRWSWDTRVKEWETLFQKLDGEVITRNSWDAQIFREVYMENEYQLESFSQDDVVIDIGAHIGSFTRACLDRGAGTVVAFEPFVENYDVLVKNTKGRKGVVTENRAVWRESDLKIPFQSNLALDPSNFGLGTAFTQIGNTKVDTVGIDDLLRRYERIRLLKIDAEGAEYPILFSATELDRVDEIVGEVHDISPDVHLTKPVGEVGDYNWQTLTNHLESKGFEVTLTDNKHGWPYVKVFRAIRKN